MLLLEFSAPVKGKGGVRRGLGTLEGKACRLDTTLALEFVVVEKKLLEIATLPE
jgi:hypothetical protein